MYQLTEAARQAGAKAKRIEEHKARSSPCRRADCRGGEVALELSLSTGSQLQPARESARNKRKIMKGNESEIAFICFHKLFRIGTFQ
jgi:hypothetical protein